MAELTIEQEQEAFEQQLEELMKVHAGEFVLFRAGKPVAFFETHGDAYAAGIVKFGPDEVFLVAPVARVPPSVISMAWNAGVMFG